MNSIMAEQRVVETQSRNIPPASNRSYKVEEDLLVYSKLKN